MLQRKCAIGSWKTGYREVMTIPEVPPIPGNPEDPDAPNQPTPGGDIATESTLFASANRHGEVDVATREQDEKDAHRHAGADREPTAEESVAAERAQEDLEGELGSVAEHYQEMSHLGADVKGEGEI